MKARIRFTVSPRRRHAWPCFGLILGIAITASANAADRVRLTDDGYLLIDGKPRLILGMYECPGDDATLKELARSGFNLVRASADTQALDRVHQAGLYAWIPLGGQLALPPSNPKARERLTKTVRTYKDHPGLLCWEAPDEALWNVWHQRFAWIFNGQPGQIKELLEQADDSTSKAKIAEWKRALGQARNRMERGLWKEGEALYDELWEALGGKPPSPQQRVSLAAQHARELGDNLTRGWQLVRSIDPSHVLWQNHAPRNSIESMRFHNRAVDAAGCDIYPVPFNYAVMHSDLADMNLTSVGAYTDRMAAAAPGKAVWMVLQGFGWRDIQEPRDPKDAARGRRPTFDETRFMAYDAVLHRANGVLYWGTHAIEKESRLWNDIMRVAAELRALEPAIVGQRPQHDPTATGHETYASVDGQGPRLMLRQAGDDWVLIAANELMVGLAFQVTGLPEQLDGKTLYRLYVDESHRVNSGGFHDGIRAHGVHVYATSRRFKAKGHSRH